MSDDVKVSDSVTVEVRRPKMEEIARLARERYSKLLSTMPESTHLQTQAYVEVVLSMMGSGDETVRQWADYLKHNTSLVPGIK